MHPLRTQRSINSRRVTTFSHVCDCYFDVHADRSLVSHPVSSFGWIAATTKAPMPEVSQLHQEVSIFESLEDNIFEISFMNFGVLVKRKTFLKGLVLVLACTFMAFIYKT